MTFCIATNWITNGIISLLFLQLIEWFTIEGVFWMFAGITLLGTIFVIIFCPETKGKSLAEIWNF